MFGFNVQDPSIVTAVAHGAALLAASSTLTVPAAGVRCAGRLAAGAGLILAWAVPVHALIVVGWIALIGLGCARNLRRAAPVSFSSEEEAVRASLLATMPPERARRILNQGFWLKLPAGETILRPGRAPAYSLVLGSGRARLIDGYGRIEARGPGALLTDSHGRSAVLDTPARLWCAPPHVFGSMRLAEIGN